MNMVINGGPKCPKCGGHKWKYETPLIYCINKDDNGDPCCWHLNGPEMQLLKIAVRKRMQIEKVIGVDNVHQH